MKTLYCSFCDKSQYEVKKLIPTSSVYICNECVDTCSGIIGNERRDFIKSYVLARAPVQANPVFSVREAEEVWERYFVVKPNVVKLEVIKP